MRKIIRTSNKDLYKKLRSFNFTDEIVLNNDASTKKILNNIRKSNDNIKTENLGNKLIVRRMSPLNINVKLRRRGR